MKILSILAVAMVAGGCAMTVNNRSQVHYVSQRAESEGRVLSNPSDASSGNSVNAERTTEAAISASSGSAAASVQPKAPAEAKEGR